MGNLKVLYYVEVEVDYKGILAIVDEDHIGTKEYKKKVKELLSEVLYVDEEQDIDHIKAFDKMVNRVAKGEDASWLDYDVAYTEGKLPVL